MFIVFVLEGAWKLYHYLAFIDATQTRILPTQVFFYFWIGRTDCLSLPTLYPQQAAVIVSSSRGHFGGLIKADEDA